MVVFSDFQCPYCAVFATNTWPDIQRSYISTGDLQVIFRHLPLEAIHSLAFGAAEAAECAGRQGMFWQMHDQLFANQEELDKASLRKHAEQLRLNTPQFSRCLDGEARGRIMADAAEATRLGVSSTPRFLIGLRDADNRLKVPRVIAGAKKIADFREIFDSLITSSQR
jgi:protein-disulfide isomerase